MLSTDVMHGIRLVLVLVLVHVMPGVTRAQPADLSPDEAGALYREAIARVAATRARLPTSGSEDATRLAASADSLEETVASAYSDLVVTADEARAIRRQLEPAGTLAPARVRPVPVPSHILSPREAHSLRGELNAKIAHFRYAVSDAEAADRITDATAAACRGWINSFEESIAASYADGWVTTVEARALRIESEELRHRLRAAPQKSSGGRTVLIVLGSLLGALLLLSL